MSLLHMLVVSVHSWHLGLLILVSCMFSSLWTIAIDMFSLAISMLLWSAGGGGVGGQRNGRVELQRLL
jgi:hypothetical protein